MSDLAYVLVQDPTGLTHKAPGIYGNHSVTAKCGLDLTGRAAIPSVVGAGRPRDLTHCRACDNAHDAHLHAAIVAAGGRGDTCPHGYGWHDSCPACDA